jgi:hypothetical protein
MMTQENWNYTYRQKGPRKVLMSLEGLPDLNNSDVVFQYRVLTCDQEDIEVYGKNFSNLEDGLTFINHLYADWSFIDPTITAADTSANGCGSCAAH